MRILIIDEDAPLAQKLKICLARENYFADVAYDYARAVTALSSHDYDCVLIEPALEGGSGIGLLQMLRSPGEQPEVIVLSGSCSVKDITRAGIAKQNFIYKPFDPAEIPPLIRNIMRRRNAGTGISFGNVELQTERYGAWIADREIDLKRKEYMLLKHLLEKPLCIVGKAELIEKVWNGRMPNDSKYDFLYMQVKNLRDKLDLAGADIEIFSVYGSGYKLIRKGPGR